jgi:outer membrane protein
MKHSFCVTCLVLFSVVRVVAQEEVTLDRAIQAGVQHSYDVLVVRRTSELARNDNSYAFGAFLPQLNATGSYLKNNINSYSATFADPPVVTDRSGVKSTNTNAQLQVLWPIFDGTKMFATRKRIEELAILGEINVRNQMMNSVAAIIVNYYNIVRQKQQLRATQELMLVSEERVKLAERKLEVGTGGKPELLQAKVDLNSQRTAILVQETLIQQLMDQLDGLVGMTLPPSYVVSDSIPIDLTLTMTEIITGIEGTNQAVVAARKNIDVAKLVLRENRATRSPIISLVGAYNYTKAENELAANPFSLKLAQNQGYNYGVQATIPIMNNMNVNRLIGAAKINLSRQEIIYDQQLAIATVGVRNAYVNYDNSKRSLEIQEENILLAKENVYIALEGFKRGITTALDLRTAQQSLADAYNQLIGSRYSAKLAETELLRLKGALLQ